MKYNILFFFVMLAGTTFFSSCIKTDYFPCIKSSGASIEELRPVGTIKSVDLSMHANVFVHQGDENTIKIKAPENLIEYIETNQKGSTLVLKTSRCVRSRSDDISLYIPVTELSSLRISGSGNIFVANTFEGQRIDMNISGSGNIHFTGFYDHVATNISGSGNINVAGECSKHDVQISGSGQINSFELEALTANVRISGSGNANVNVLHHMDARISGSGNVYYKGNPSISLSVSGSGKVVHFK
jgi:hypothetical protein